MLFECVHKYEFTIDHKKLLMWSSKENSQTIKIKNKNLALLKYLPEIQVYIRRKIDKKMERKKREERKTRNYKRKVKTRNIHSSLLPGRSSKNMLQLKICIYLHGWEVLK